MVAWHGWLLSSPAAVDLKKIKTSGTPTHYMGSDLIDLTTFLFRGGRMIKLAIVRVFRSRVHICMVEYTYPGKWQLSSSCGRSGPRTLTRGRLVCLKHHAYGHVKRSMWPFRYAVTDPLTKFQRCRRLDQFERKFYRAIQADFEWEP